MRDFSEQVSPGRITSVRWDHDRLIVAAKGLRRLGFPVTAVIEFSAATRLDGRDLRSDLANPTLEPGWRIDGLVQEGGEARMEVSRQAGPGDTEASLFTISCEAVYIKRRPSISWRPRPPSL